MLTNKFCVAQLVDFSYSFTSIKNSIRIINYVRKMAYILNITMKSINIGTINSIIEHQVHKKMMYFIYNLNMYVFV